MLDGNHLSPCRWRRMPEAHATARLLAVHHQGCYAATHWAWDLIKKPFKIKEMTVDKKRLDELRQLVEQAMNAPTKKEAQHSIRRLEFMASSVKGEIDPYFSGKLGEVISYAKEASGRVKNKDHWISCLERCWYVFENGVKEVNEMKT